MPPKNGTPGGGPGRHDHVEPAPQYSAKPWRDVVPVHPCAAIFPEITPDEKKDLAASIGQVGLREKVTLWRAGENVYLLDGRSRLDALELRGVPFLKDGKITDDYAQETDAMSSFTPAEVVIAANIRRRHLTPSERVDLVVATIAAYEATKKPTTGKSSPVVGEQDNPTKQKGDFRKTLSGSSPNPDRLIAEGGAGDPETIANLVADSRVRSHRATGKAKTGRPRGDVAKIAKLAGVSKPTARSAIRAARGEAKSERPVPRPPVARTPTPTPPVPPINTQIEEASAKVSLDTVSRTIEAALLSFQNDPTAGRDRKGNPAMAGPAERRRLVARIERFMLPYFKKGRLAPFYTKLGTSVASAAEPPPATLQDAQDSTQQTAPDSRGGGEILYGDSAERAEWLHR